MADPVAAGIAFFALGATLLGAGLLLLFNPRSRDVRWFTVFNAALIGWLLGQAMRAVHGYGTPWDIVHWVSVMLLPAIFFASAWVVEKGRPSWHAVAGLAAAVLLLPVLLFPVLPLQATPILPHAYAQTFVLAWQVAGWVGGALLMGPFRSAKRRGPETGRRGGMVIGILLASVPLAVAAGMVPDSGWLPLPARCRAMVMQPTTSLTGCRTSRAMVAGLMRGGTSLRQRIMPRSRLSMYLPR
jgi:hypothetical protein